MLLIKLACPTSRILDLSNLSPKVISTKLKLSSYM